MARSIREAFELARGAAKAAVTSGRPVANQPFPEVKSPNQPAAADLLKQVLSTLEPEAATQKLKEMVYERGAGENLTEIIIKIIPPKAVKAAARLAGTARTTS